MTVLPDFHQFSVLNTDGTDAIRSAAFRLLEHTGMLVVDSSLRQFLHDHGAAVNGDRVRLSGQMVSEAISQAPHDVRLWSRDGRAISSADGRPYHGVAPSAVAVLDYDGQRRRSTYADVANLTRLADALPGIDFISPPVIAQDCPQADSGLLTAEAAFSNTHKFCLAFALNWGEAQTWLEMGRCAAGSWAALAEQPVLGFAISPVSPLVLPKETTDILVGVAQRGLPIFTVPGGMAGATSPYTLAGTLVVELAEALAVITIAQLMRPGTPNVLGLATAVMDMASGNICLGTPERTLILNAVAPLARSLDMPGYAPVGLTDSFALDEQAGGEKMLSFITQFLSGLPFGSGVGRCEGGLSCSYEGLVLDHELLQMARRFLSGIRVDAETLAEEVIAQVGPGGNFLNEAHTLKFLRSDEFRSARLFNRRALENGGRPAVEAAHAQVERVLASHASPVPETMLREFKSIATGYRQKTDRSIC